MNILTKAFVRFLKQEDGVTALECALMLALIIVICVVALNQVNPSTVANDPVVITMAH